MVCGLADGLVHRVHDELGRGLVGVADAEVDYVAAGVAGCLALAVDIDEEVGGQGLQAVGFSHGHERIQVARKQSSSVADESTTGRGARQGVRWNAGCLSRVFRASGAELGAWLAPVQAV